MIDYSQTFDHTYWKDGIHLERWGWACMRGLEYRTTGAPVPEGTKGQVRKISVGRKKHRGMASDDLKY